MAALILRWAVALLTSGFVSAFLLRRALRAEAALSVERGARQTAEADLAAARDELAARAGERRLLALAKRDAAAAEDESGPSRPSSSSSGGLIAGGRVVTMRLRLRRRRL